MSMILEGPMKPQAPQSIEFEFPPPVGTIVMFRGQRYEMVGTAPHTRRDGSEITLLRWASHCARCGDAMEAKTVVNGGSPNRRCDECKAPGVRA